MSAESVGGQGHQAFGTGADGAGMALTARQNAFEVELGGRAFGLADVEGVGAQVK